MQRREGNRRIGRYFALLVAILAISGLVLLLQDDILADYHDLEIPEKIREATRIDEVIEKIGGFELEEDFDLDDDDDEDEVLIDNDDDAENSNQEEIDEEIGDIMESNGDNENEDVDEKNDDEEDVEDEDQIVVAPTVQIAISNSSTQSQPHGKYLIVFKFMEQLTKATMALEEIILLAQELNRTLVLPRVGSSTIGFQPSVNVFPLDFYFQIDSLQNTIDFDSWWQYHRENISHSVRFANSKYPLSRCRQGGPHTVTFYDKTLRFLNSTCFKGEETSFNSVVEMLRQLNDSETIALPGYRAAQFKIDPSTAARLQTLRFNKRIIDQVDVWIATYVREPFLAIHWRTETIATDVLEACAHALVDYAQEKMVSKNLSLVYFATDIGPERKSITLKDQAKKLSIYEIVMEGLDSPRTYKRDDNMFNTHGDSGILGIIEKVICTRADYFLGLQGHCAKHSSYTRDIVAMRDELHEESEIEWPVDIGKLKREYIAMR